MFVRKRQTGPESDRRRHDCANARSRPAAQTGNG
jgi:hypothetical protein